MKPDGWGSWPAPSTSWRWKNKKNQKASKKAAFAAFLMLPQPSAWAPILRCRARQQNQPFLRHSVRIALWHLPGGGVPPQANCAPGPVPGLPYCAAALGNRTSLFCGTLLGLHQGPCRCWLASAGALRNSSAYSRGEYGRPDTGLQICRCVRRETVV